uniref:Uncharacterized protein n=1 Tax=Trichobilharzia regenti TaxID=157069 RepID=A0AA85KAT0_TRIRE|nr:unnamed protein product [Trichobilharzia regenti]
MYTVPVLFFIFATAATNSQSRNKYSAPNTQDEPIPESLRMQIKEYANAYYEAKSVEYSQLEGSVALEGKKGEKMFRNEVKRLETIFEAGWFRDYVKKEYAKAAKTHTELNTYMYENLNVNIELFAKWTSRFNLDTEVDFYLRTYRQTNSQQKSMHEIKANFKRAEQEYHQLKAKTNNLLALAVQASLNSRNAIDVAWEKVKNSSAVLAFEDDMLDYDEIIEDYQYDLKEIEAKIREATDASARQKLLVEKEDIERNLKQNEDFLSGLQKLKDDTVDKEFAKDEEIKRKGDESNQAMNEYFSSLGDLKNKVTVLEVQRVEYLKPMTKEERITEMKRAMEEEIKQ